MKVISEISLRDFKFWSGVRTGQGTVPMNNWIKLNP